MEGTCPLRASNGEGHAYLVNRLSRRWSDGRQWQLNAKQAPILQSASPTRGLPSRLLFILWVSGMQRVNVGLNVDQNLGIRMPPTVISF